MPETKDCILKHPVFEDWKALYRNVWSQEACAKYMLWDVTDSEEAAKERMHRTIAFQDGKPAWIVYLKSSLEPIGFAGMTEESPGVWAETGIAICPRLFGHGYGKQILNVLTEYAKQEFGATRFQASCRSQNIRSRNMILSCGFHPTLCENRVDPRNGAPYIVEFFEKEL